MERPRSKKPPLHFDEERALEVFRTLGDMWREHRGTFARLVPPQQRYTPKELRRNPLDLGHWFFTLSLPMRGGINSEDAFRFMRALWGKNRDLFNPLVVMLATEASLAAAIRATAAKIHNGGSKGTKGAGTLSYKLEEHVRIWIQNASVLVKYWGGDIRNVYCGATSFEDAFRRIEGSRTDAGFNGMRRKIFSLLTLWLQEFELIPKFPMPLIVDFHVMRVLLEQEIWLPEWSQLGPGQSKRPDRQRPPSLWEYPAVKVTEGVVNQIIAWSENFLAKHKLLAHEVSHALWFLSRELCASYHGNSARAKVVPGRHGITERLVAGDELATFTGWPKEYRDPCRLCPVEQTCALRIPAGPYYDWGVLVNSGKHVVFPGRPSLLPGIDWGAMPGSFPSSKRRNS